LVGLIPLLASDTIELRTIERYPGFRKRMQWFIDHRKDLTEGLASMTECGEHSRRLLSVVNRSRLERILQRLFDESEFLSPYGIRSLSRYHKDRPYHLNVDGSSFEVNYEPAESETGTFGGNSNWRGPIWFPMNFNLIEALQRLGHYYGNSLQVEFPTGSGQRITLSEAACKVSQRLSSVFLSGAALGESKLREYPLFYEYFNGDTGKGLGASHQTGWTGLVAKLLQQSGVA
jgi:hypothetical protein